LYDQLGNLGHHGKAQPVGDGGCENRSIGVSGLLSEQSEVKFLVLDDLCEDVASHQQIGSSCVLIAEEKGAVATHRESPQQRLPGSLRPERDSYDLGYAEGLLDTNRFLDSMQIEGVDHERPASVNPHREGIKFCTARLRNSLDANRDPHSLTSPVSSIVPP